MVTVMIAPGVNPSPDIIFEILIGSAANAPTISNSGLCGANPSSFAGNLSVVSIILSVESVSYTHLTLPTNREV